MDLVERVYILEKDRKRLFGEDFFLTFNFRFLTSSISKNSSRKSKENDRKKIRSLL